MPRLEDIESKIWIPLMVGIAAAIGMIAGYNMNRHNYDQSMIAIDNYEESLTIKDGRIEEIIRFIETNYVDSINQDILTVDAIRHIMKQLDPHSDYITPEELESHNERMDGAYRGIGIETVKLRDTFYISKIINDGPAEKAGMQLGDAIMKISGQLVSGNETEYSSLRSQLKSPKNKSLEIEVIALDGSQKKYEVQVSQIPLASADLYYMLDDNTVYIKLIRFSSNTFEQFVESVDQAIKGKPYINLVLDLRENPGGFLPEAIKILSQLFDEKDKLLSYTEGLNRKKSDYRSTGKNYFNIKKVAILINEYSASGSEIIAGAIQDWDRGVVIGKPSFGKGLVQEIFPLNNGGALRLTVAKYYTPSGRLIQKSYGSTTNEFVADSLEYTTKLLQRKVNSGVGIIPDIQIDNDFDIDCYAYDNYIDFFLIDALRREGKMAFDPETMNEQALDAFIYDLYGDDPAILKEPCNRNINTMIFGRYLRMTEGDVEYKKYVNSDDPYIEEAMQIVGSQKTTLALLAEE